MSLPTRPAVLGLYRRTLRMIPAYVASPGVKRFALRDLSAAAKAENLSPEDVAEIKMALMDPVQMRDATYEIASHMFMRNAGMKDVAAIEAKVATAHAYLDSVQSIVIDGQGDLTEELDMSTLAL